MATVSERQADLPVSGCLCLNAARVLVTITNCEWKGPSTLRFPLSCPEWPLISFPVVLRALLVSQESSVFLAALSMLVILHWCPQTRWQYGLRVGKLSPLTGPPLAEQFCKCISESVSCSVVSDSLWPKKCSPPGSSVWGILQATILEWVALSFSRGSSWPRDWTQVSWIADDSSPSELPGNEWSVGHS